MLKAENLNVYYGKIHALKDVSFEVHPGEIVALIGANGAGKSTTLKTVSGMLHCAAKPAALTFMDRGSATHTESYHLISKGPGACAGRPPRVFADDGRRKTWKWARTHCPGTGDFNQQGLADVYKQLPAAVKAPQKSGRRDAFRR